MPVEQPAAQRAIQPTVSAAQPAIPAELPAASAPARPVAASQAAFLPPTPPAPPEASAPARATARTAPVLLRDLPPDVRQQLPALKLSGSIHSPDPSKRLLIVDGQVAHEGDTVAPDLVLEQIQPRSAVFRFRQQRYEVPY
jgi:general secretion pathway protein B